MAFLTCADVPQRFAFVKMRHEASPQDHTTRTVNAKTVHQPGLKAGPANPAEVLEPEQVAHGPDAFTAIVNQAGKQ